MSTKSKLMTIGQKYKFEFAGSELIGEYLGEKELHNGDVVKRLKYNGCIYPVRDNKIFL